MHILSYILYLLFITQIFLPQYQIENKKILTKVFYNLRLVSPLRHDNLSRKNIVTIVTVLSAHEKRELSINCSTISLEISLDTA